MLQPEPARPPRSRRRTLLTALAVAALLAVGAAIVRHELRQYDLQDVKASLAALTAGQLGAALVLTALSYLLLTGYDYLALRYADKKLPYYKVAAASFVGYVFSYNVGLSVLGGSATRYRLYSSWGLSPLAIARIVAFCNLTFWVGVFATGGLSFVLTPLAVPDVVPLPGASVRPIGIVFLVLLASYLVLAFWRSRPFLIRGVEVGVPRPRLALAQAGLASLDWFAAAGVLFVLLPEPASASFLHFIGIFLLAQLAGVVSHVPGGLGVLESVLLFFLTPETPAPALLASVAAYRAIYYLLPLFGATAILGANELLLRRGRVTELLAAVSWPRRIIPSVYALAVFAAGSLLLLSGVTRGDAARLGRIHETLPLPLVELAHLSASLAGAALLVAAHGLQRRVDTAYVAALTALATGVIASLLKGMEFELSGLLAVVGFALLPAKDEFERREPWLGIRMSARWTIAVFAALGAALWLFELGYRGADPSELSFWRFGATEGPRSVRAIVGAVLFVGAVLAVRLLRHPRSGAPPPRPGGGRDPRAFARRGDGRSARVRRSPGLASGAGAQAAPGDSVRPPRGAKAWRTT